MDAKSSDIRTHWVQGAGISSSFSDDTMTNISWRGPHPLLAFAAGAAGGFASRTATAPFDRIRILQQTASGPGESAIGLMRTAADVFRREGVRGFWKGNLANLAKVVPQAAIVCAVYTQLLASMGVVELNDRPYLRFASGATSGIVAATLTFPLDVIRTRLAAQMANPPGAAWTSRGLHNTVTAGGVRSLFGGAADAAAASSGGIPSRVAGCPAISRTVTAGTGLCHRQAAGRAVPSPYGTRGRLARPEGPGHSARVRSLPSKIRAAPNRLWTGAGGQALPLRRAAAAIAHSDLGVARRAASTLASSTASSRMLSHSSARRAADGVRSFVSGAIARVSGTAQLGAAAGVTRYRGIMDAAATIWRTEGSGGFFKGIKPTVISVALFVGVQQAGYDLILPLVSASLDVAALSASQASSRALSQAKDRLRRAGMGGASPQQQNGGGGTIVARPAFWHSVVAGGFIGMAAQTLVHPLDTLRRRIQVHQTEWVRPMQALREVVRSSGLRGLYRGCLAANLKVAPSVAITLCARDAFLGRLDWR